MIIEPGPGAQPFPAELVAQLGRAERHAIRTRHLREDGTPKWTNRLALETSLERVVASYSSNSS